jgi:hypothetical protein
MKPRSGRRTNSRSLVVAVSLVVPIAAAALPAVGLHRTDPPAALLPSWTSAVTPVICVPGLRPDRDQTICSATAVRRLVLVTCCGKIHNGNYDRGVFVYSSPVAAS